MASSLYPTDPKMNPEFIATVQAALVNNNKVKIRLVNLHLNALVDTGANVSVIQKRTFDKLKYKPELDVPDILNISGVGGAVYEVLGKCDLEINVNGLKLPHTFQVIEDMCYPIILGQDFLSMHKAKIDLEEKIVSFCDNLTVAALIHSPVQASNSKDNHIFARTASDISIRPNSETNIVLAISKF